MRELENIRATDPMSEKFIFTFAKSFMSCACSFLWFLSFRPSSLDAKFCWLEGINWKIRELIDMLSERKMRIAWNLINLVIYLMFEFYCQFISFDFEAINLILLLPYKLMMLVLRCEKIAISQYYERKIISRLLRNKQRRYFVCEEWIKRVTQWNKRIKVSRSKPTL